MLQILDLGLNASVDVFSSPANFTFHLTTPVKYAVTPFCHYFFVSAVPSTTAHNIATVYANGGCVTYPAMGPLDAKFGVSLAKTRTHFVVHQVLGTWGFVFGIERFQLKVIFLFPSVVSFAVYAVPGDAVVLEIITEHSSVCFVVSMMVVSGCYVRSTIESVLEDVTNNSEGRQFHPACFHRTGSRHTVTFTFFLHMLTDML